MGWDRNNKSEWGTPPGMDLGSKVVIAAAILLLGFCLFSACQGMVS